jgi:probable rRNA maturation factor
VRAKPEQDEAPKTAAGLVLEVTAAPEALAAEPEVQAFVATAIETADEIAGPTQGVVAVLVDGDERIRTLNRDWRGIDKATNVLSFCYPDSPAGAPKHIGDIAISFETAAAEAAAEGKPFAHHMKHLAVHGFLHVLGYDHESDEDADAMEQLERTILARLGVPDPYIARDAEG